MNPELLRNVWLELTVRRLIATPLVLGTILWGLWQISAAAATAAAGVLFIVFTVLWGTFQAGDAVASEVAEHTWDWQRLSTLTGWELTWGKLIGSTLYSWYGAIICLAVRFILLVPEHGLMPMLHVTAFLVGGALLGQAAAFLLGLQTVRVRGHRTRIGTLVSQLTGVVIGLLIIGMGSFLPAGMLGSFDLIRLAPEVDWYGFLLTAPTVASVTLVACLAWTLLGSHRVMLREMAHRVHPWAWPSFVGFACFYMAGFEPAAMSAASVPVTARVAGWLVTATGVSAILTYAALFWDEKDPVTFRRLIRLSDARDLRGFASHLPSYFTSYLITIALAFLLLVVGGTGVREGVLIWPAVIGVLLYMFRDIGINLYFGMAPHHDHANLMTLIVLGLLYGLLPLLAFFSIGSEVIYLFIPLWPGPWYGVLAMGGIQATVVALLVMRRWRARFVLAGAA